MCFKETTIGSFFCFLGLFPYFLCVLGEWCRIAWSARNSARGRRRKRKKTKKEEETKNWNGERGKKEERKKVECENQ